MPTPGIYYRDLHNEPDNSNAPAPLGAGNVHTSNSASTVNTRSPYTANMMDPNRADAVSTYGSANTAALDNQRQIDGVLDGPYDRGLHNTLEAAPTDSHALATGTPDLKGLAQQGTTAHVKDLGWNEPKEVIPSPLVGGLQNEDLWILIRRFNKVAAMEDIS